MFRISAWAQHSSDLPKLSGIISPYVGDKSLSKKYNGMEMVKVSSARKCVNADYALLEELYSYSSGVRSSVLVEFNKAGVSLLDSSVRDVVDYFPSFYGCVSIMKSLPDSARFSGTVDQFEYLPDTNWIVSPNISGGYNDPVFMVALGVDSDIHSRVRFLESVTGVKVSTVSGDSFVLDFPGSVTSKQQLCLMAKLGLVALSSSGVRLLGGDVNFSLPLAK